MTELRRGGRHAAAASTAPRPPAGVEPDEVWVPPPFEPARPGDFVEFSSGGFEVRRSRRGLVILLCLLLAAAAGGTWWYLRHRTSAARALTCQQVYDSMPAPLHRYLRVTDGGTLPDGIPVPLGDPGRRCTVSNSTGSGLIVVWPDASESGYATLLTAGGWGSARTVGDYTLYVNGGDKRGVVTTVVDGQLVTMYDR